MSQKIAILSDTAINQIAAGEVVEGPASVIKELVENAIDAKASNICVEIVGGGHFSIQVSDDGSGMEKDNVLLSMQRYATSKISCLQDLETLCSMGFRGEALAAISSVSKFTIHSSTGEIGICLKCSGGKNPEIMTRPRNKGTTITVESLFYNTPARKKFQKSRGASTSEIVKSVTKLALCHRDIHFTLIVDSKEVFSTKKSGNDRIKGILGEKFFDPEIAVFLEKDGIKIEGYITSFDKTRSNRLGQYLVVNKRGVYSNLISNAVSAGFGTSLGKGEFPLFFLDMTFDPSTIDVNVHPQKKEIRFSNPQNIFAVVREMVSTFLAGKQVITEVSSHPYLEKGHHEEKTIDSNIFKNFSYVTKEDEMDYHQSSMPNTFVQHQFEGIGKISILLLWDEVCIMEVIAPHKKFPGIDDKGHFIVDLSILERRAANQNNTLLSQKLLSKEEVFLTRTEMSLCNEHFLEMEELGIKFEVKETSVLINSMPEICIPNKKEIFMDILEHLRKYENIEDIKEKIISMIFQKKKYSREEALLLIERADGVNIGTQILKKDVKRLCKELIT